MGTYTRHTRGWLDRRYRRVDEHGVYQAHMPIYGLGHPASEAGHAVRYAISYRLLDALDGLEFDSLLAVGGGEGFLPQLVRTAFGVDVVVADLSIEAALRARDVFDLDGVAADATRLPFADDAFDAVVCSEVIEHLEFPVEAMLELQRVAKRVVLLTTLEFETDPLAVARHRFQRCRFPHFEQNLYLATDLVQILGGGVRLASQFPMDLPEDGVTRAELAAWLERAIDVDTVVAGGAGVFAVDERVPSAREPRVGRARLLDVLFDRVPAPATALVRRRRDHVSPQLMARCVCPLTHESLREVDGALVSASGRRFEIVDGAPVLYDLDVPDPTEDELCARIADRTPEAVAALVRLRRDLVHDESTSERRRWDLVKIDERRGWMLNPRLVERPGSGLAVTSLDSDPWFVAPALFLPADEVFGVRLRMVVHAPDVDVAGGTGQLFWALDDDDVFVEERSVLFDVANSPDVREYAIDLRHALRDAHGRTLLMLRLDPVDGPCGIDLIEFEVVTRELVTPDLPLREGA